MKVEQPSMAQEIASTVKLLYNRKMMYINMQLSLTGISIAYWSGMLTPIMILSLNDRTNLDDNHKTRLALFGMIAFGFGEMFGGYIMGVFIDNLGSKVGSVKCIILCILTTAITYISIDVNEYNYVSYTMCFFWGYFDGCINIHCLQIMGFQFVSKSEPFAVFNIVQGLTIFLMQVLQG